MRSCAAPSRATACVWGRGASSPARASPEFLPAARGANARGFAVAATILGESVARPRRDAGGYRRVLSAAARICAAKDSTRTSRSSSRTSASTSTPSSPSRTLDASSRSPARRQHGPDGHGAVALRRSHARDLPRGCASAIENVGFVLQSYLYRSRADLHRDAAARTERSHRQGRLSRTAAVAYPRKRDVDENYVELVELALSHDGYTAIATHDPQDRRSRRCRLRRREGCRKRGRFEFQMLYGIATPLARASSSAAIACGSRSRTASTGFRI